MRRSPRSAGVNFLAFSVSLMISRMSGPLSSDQGDFAALEGPGFAFLSVIVTAEVHLQSAESRSYQHRHKRRPFSLCTCLYTVLSVMHCNHETLKICELNIDEVKAQFTRSESADPALECREDNMRCIYQAPQPFVSLHSRTEYEAHYRIISTGECSQFVHLIKLFLTNIFPSNTKNKSHMFSL